MGARICRQRGSHRFIVADPHGPDVDVYDECVDCGAPNPPYRPATDLARVVEIVHGDDLAPDCCALLTASHAVGEGIDIDCSELIARLTSSPEQSSAAVLWFASIGAAALQALATAIDADAETLLHIIALNHQGASA